MIYEIFFLLIIFQLKHFVADYILQGKYMLQKFRPDWGFFLPLLAHAGVHGLFTLAICLWISPSLWWLALVDVIAHFIMDRIKAGPKYLGRFKALSAKEYIEIVKDKELWNSFSNETKQLKDVNTKYKKQEQQLKHNIYFWWSLSVDQAVHHLTHYGIIFILIMDKI